MTDEEFPEEIGVRADETESIPEWWLEMLREMIEGLASLQSTPAEERREQHRLIVWGVIKNYTEELRKDAIESLRDFDSKFERLRTVASKAYIAKMIAELEARKGELLEIWRCEGSRGATLKAWP